MISKHILNITFLNQSELDFLHSYIVLRDFKQFSLASVKSFVYTQSLF